jgi:Tol biopolymer transport system component
MQRRALIAVLGIAVAQPGTSQPAQASHVTLFITSDLNATDEWPCFTPDGQTVLFSRTTDGGKHWDLFVVPTAEGAARPLTNAPLPVSATRPDWSRRNNQITFTGTSGDGFSDVWLIDPDGTHARALALTGLTEVVFYPTWYPDGDHMVVRDVGAQAIKRIDLRSHTAEMQTHREQILAGMVAVSPDGNWLAIAGQKDAGQSYARATNAIWLLGPTGELRSLETPPKQGRNPSWSPDGRRLAFTSTRGNPQQLAGAFIIKPDGTDLRQVTLNDLNASHPVWSRMGNGSCSRPSSRRIHRTELSRSSISRPEGGYRSCAGNAISRAAAWLGLSPSHQRA